MTTRRLPYPSLSRRPPRRSPSTVTLRLGGHRATRSSTSSRSAWTSLDPGRRPRSKSATSPRSTCRSRWRVTRQPLPARRGALPRSPMTPRTTTCRPRWRSSSSSTRGPESTWASMRKTCTPAPGWWTSGTGSSSSRQARPPEDRASPAVTIRHATSMTSSPRRPRSARTTAAVTRRMPLQRTAWRVSGRIRASRPALGPRGRGSSRCPGRSSPATRRTPSSRAAPRQSSPWPGSIQQKAPAAGVTGRLNSSYNGWIEVALP